MARLLQLCPKLYFWYAKVAARAFAFILELLIIFTMIPLSNGRSPRIDQFYATLRTYKSHQFHEETQGRSDE